MKQSELKQLNDIVAQLERIKDTAPGTSTYKAGRVQAGIAQQLQALIIELRKLTGDHDDTESAG